MVMRHFLMCCHAIIANQAEATGGGTDCGSGFLHGLGKANHFSFAGIAGEIAEIPIRAFGDDQRMDWCLGLNIVKSQGKGIFINFAAGNFAPQQPGENIGVVVRC